MIELLFALFDKPYEPSIAVAAAYAIHAGVEEAPAECCGECVGGKIIHGDGHVTDCPCPPDCQCKQDLAVVHPPVVIKPKAVKPKTVTKRVTGSCPDGNCRVR